MSAFEVMFEFMKLRIISSHDLLILKQYKKGNANISIQEYCQLNSTKAMFRKVLIWLKGSISV